MRPFPVTLEMATSPMHDPSHPDGGTPLNSASQPAAPGSGPPSEGMRSGEDARGAAPDHGPPVIVGIGASAGGIPAVQELLGNLPADIGMGFVVVQHLAPDHDSALTDILQQQTPLIVRTAGEGVPVQAGHVYVIPPDRSLTIRGGILHLEDRDQPHTRRNPADRFLNALARDQGNRAVGVVLSGSGSDGTLGVKAIKTGGGITFAQDEASAEHPDMPRSAVRSGQVDFVCPPREIAANLARIAGHPYLWSHWPEQTPLSEEALNRVLRLLRKHTGHDFSDYKTSTIKRRIQRRMSLNQIKQLDSYVRLLKAQGDEVERLFQDLLINVTGFFRDPESFEALKHAVFPAITPDGEAERTLRIWVPGCSTGEEAYSVAIALLEYLGDDWLRTPIQIFATDIDKEALDRARTAIYPESVVSQLSAERLSRFFVRVPGGYQVHENVRNLCIFAPQDMVQDPPFSRLDLICCRNVLIYMDPVLQNRCLNIFHFALAPHGFLMLGSAETVGTDSDLFAMVDQTSKIYSKRAVRTPMPTISGGAGHPSAPEATERPPSPENLERRLHREATDHLLADYAPPSVVVDTGMNILTFLGETGPYIAPSPGRASRNLYKMAHRDLQAPLRKALTDAMAAEQEVCEGNVRMRRDGDLHYLSLRVRPLRSDPGKGHFLVIFDRPDHPVPPAPVRLGEQPEGEQDRWITELEHELATTREQMQSIINEQVTTNEELQTANEEVQSANEELQSTNEELESAKEELQSTNEELSTVNRELENRNQDLSEANGDLHNLLRSIDLAILMVTEDLRIRRFTPRAKELLNLIDADTGRPLTDIRPNVELPDLAQMIRDVLDMVGPKCLEVRDHGGNWYALTVRPYKTEENRITGAVLIFSDISDFKTDPQQVRRLAAVAREAVPAIVLADLTGRILAWNRGAHEHFGFTEAEAAERSLWGLVPPDDHQAARALLERLRQGERVSSYTARRLTKQGEILSVWGSAIPLRDPTGQVYAASLMERDIAALQDYPVPSRNRP
ncbi:chemotaxis protein CheB [Thiohalorhabdus sp. Cl-TMA]|uniref:protein-glutamate O-methyltransferase n=1 Tax=Thiohalorhabdus methylotrophus TaxID=3242694 RepID=A0ABV4TVF4_9GAMM